MCSPEGLIELPMLMCTMQMHTYSTSSVHICHMFDLLLVSAA
jgi:hypothetical protein